MTDARGLSIPTSHPHARELTTLHESGLITGDQGRALAQATTQWNVLKSVVGATTDGRPPPRHFSKVDHVLAVRIPTPVGQARDLLATIGTTWDTLSGEFHRFREMFMEAKVKRAELNKKAREITEQIGTGELHNDDQAILEAQIQLDGARIDKLEAEVQRGQAALKSGISIMAERSTRYQSLLTAAGKSEFAPEDFLAEEIDYLLKSAWMVAAQSYGATPTLEASGMPSPRSRIALAHEIQLYFANLGVTWSEIESEFSDLQMQRVSYDMAKNPASTTNFSAQFDNWITRMAVKYRPRVITAVAQHGMDRLKAIQEIIEPPSDSGHHGDAAPKRRSVLL